MAKRTTLNVSALRAAAEPQPNPVDKLEQAKAGTGTTAGRQRSRIGKVAIQGFFEPQLRDRLKILSVRTGRTVEDLLGEAIADFLERNE